ncbi:MAG: FkbM family methyltransferase [Brumimicrobium sp.]|nr:FkbM family methyltransferase [Brumimicrobium sp.]
MKRVLNKILKPLHKSAYAQGGEDMILNTLFAGIRKGKYIDIGANSPFEQSNTAFFYKKGWSGYNIDANPESVKRLNKGRKRDKNILAFISDENHEVTYNYYENSLYNGAENELEIPSPLLKKEKIKSKTVKQIRTEFLITEQIDFLSIDIEGYDLKVLQSLDLKEFRPRAIVIESFDYLVRDCLNNEITEYLKKYDYHFIAKTITNCIYISNEFYKERFIKQE